MALTFVLMIGSLGGIFLVVHDIREKQVDTVQIVQSEPPPTPEAASRKTLPPIPPAASAQNTPSLSASTPPAPVPQRVPSSPKAADPAPAPSPAPPVGYSTKLPRAIIRKAAQPSKFDREIWETIAPTPGKPLRLGKNRDTFTALVSRYIKTPFPLMTAHPAANTFPGPVPSSAPRITKTLHLPANISGWQSTGLYAPPGELIRVRLSQNDLKRGLTIQIGCHTDDLSNAEEVSEWRRFPKITTSTSATNPETPIANPFGGLIYIINSNNSAKPRDKIRVEIVGAIEAPFYRLGETSADEWQRLRQAPAPWGELACRSIVLSVPSKYLQNLKDPEELMKTWEKIIDGQDWLAALPKRTTHPERIVPDEQLTLGYMHSGYPIMCHQNPSARHLVDNRHLTVEGDWGLFHESGHNHQRGEWTFAGFGETTCNLFALFSMETIAGKERFAGGPNLEKYLAEKLADPAGANGSDHHLSIYMPVLREFGWPSLRATFAEYLKPDTAVERRLKARIAKAHARQSAKAAAKKRLSRRDSSDSLADATSNEDLKADLRDKERFVLLWSKHTKHNLGPYFEKVGFPYTHSMKNALTRLKPWLPPEVHP
ncbi:MAG: M60 family metallopeptidase [Puniceicoccales bacterium]|jgi:hypothetical protein|nr:M60 family metallopeptidase [Puniceicoccales bacterium]